MTSLRICRPIQRRLARQVLGRFGWAMVALGLAACVETGDFGRRTPSFFSGRMAHDPTPDRLSSAYTWSDDETELHNRAFIFLAPPRAPIWPVPAALDDVIGSSFEVYYERLTGLPDQSPSARYRRLEGDIEADRANIPPYRRLACLVRQTDRQREQALAATSHLDDLDRSDLLIRMTENRTLDARVETAMRTRLQIFTLSAERLRLSSPDPLAGEVNAALALLKREIASRPVCRAAV